MGAPTIGQHTQPGKGKENPVGLGGGTVMGQCGWKMGGPKGGQWERHGVQASSREVANCPLKQVFPKQL